ncbi:MAG: aminotransferase class I/II-fold pyridoxal phosphate-dependent enzyme [Helicobacteraceae bacterium]|nr:aminotransferase class I/II-fold pyridoxal phosphate-dependent enzyme [Helicobacteraceae bacterium]
MLRVPFFRPISKDISPDLLREALSGDRLKLLTQLEKRVADYLGAPYAIAATNPATAIHLALCAIDMKRGDKIFSSVNAHPAASQMIRHFDAEPRFVDIDPDSFHMSFDDLEEKLTQNRAKKIRGIFYTLAAGQSDGLERLFRIAKKRGVLSIAESFGAFGFPKALKNGAPDILVTSLLPIDCFSSSANVGFIATHNPEFAKRARQFRNYALDYENAANTPYAYDAIDVGYDYQPSALDIAYAIDVLPFYEEDRGRRAKNADIYDEAFGDLAHITPPVKKGDHAYSSYIIKVDKNRDDFARALLAKGIETRVHYIPLHLMSYYRAKYSIKITDFPRALSNYQHILSLPNFTDMNDEEREIVIDAVKEVDQNRAW